MSHIYTKKGDFGQTDLFDPKTGKKVRVEKNDLRLETIGTIDETVCLLGLIKVRLFKKDLIEKIQTDLFRINSILAGFHLPFPKNRVLFLEKEINRIEKELKPIKGFILPGENATSAYFHLARAVVRRAERNLVTLSRTEKIKPTISAYLNRLSDLLFVLAREAFK